MDRVILVIAIVLVLAIELSGLYLLQERFGKPQGDVARNSSAVDGKMTPLFVSIPPVLAHLGDGSQSHHLSLSLEVMTRENETASLLSDQMPLIRNEVVAIFDQKPLTSVTTLAGKQSILQEALERVRNVIHAEGGDGSSVEGVYFSSLVVE